ncbi:TPA: Tn3 family transposase [Escherichia coli]|uniref:Tn3 family transposase n=1 Tax=Escherichia coli TaxID=562 RepID=UPI0025A527B9|nr:Tn3 family transposase [Escherichia coli]
MPRRSILSAAERESLLALPDSKDDLIRHYTFNDTDLSIIRQRRGPANRLGFAVQLCYLRFPGVILGVDELPFPPLLKLVADQLKVGVESWNEYGQREQTRREHLSELQTVFGFRPFTMSHYRQAVQMLTELAMQTDKGIVLASALIGHLRRQSVILPALNAVERASAEAITRANRRIYDALAEPLADAHRRRLDDLLKRRDNGKTTWLAWLRQSPAKPNSRHMLEHIERLKAWQALDLPTGIDRRYYELCALSELKNSLRSGDIWVQGSRQFKDFEDYLVPPEKFTSLKQSSELPLAVATDCEQYLHERLTLLEAQLATVNRMAAANDLPDAIITESGLKITPLDAAVPDTAQALIDQTAMVLPHVKITELLLEVDEWTGFTRHFTHLKSGDLAKDKNLLLTTILADAINLGLTKMAESCPGTTYAKLAWLQAWHTRDETYSTALAELVNAQFRHPFAGHWGDGTTSSSDGQNFRTASKAKSTGHINPKYGSSPGRTFYTHISDQYAPFHTKVVNVGLRDSTYVLDGLLYHESDLRIEEHYTDTAGFTDHVFALMHLLGFRFAPRIRDLVDTKLYIPKGDAAYDALKPMIGGTLNIKHVRAHWDEILRLATSIKQGTVTASLMLRKLGSYPRQNGLAVALRELGRIERTLFILDWLQSVELRRRVHAGLNKGEARNALARAVFFNRLGEIRDRSFEQQRYRASGLNLVTAAIVLWNTVYLERAAHALRGNGHAVDDSLLQYLSPLGWEHINLTGDYLWRSSAKIGAGKFRPLRPLQPA